MAGVLAEFPDVQDDSLTGRKAVDAAMADDAPSGEGAPTAADDERQPVYIGVDVARFGYDKSALIARRGQRVIAIKAFVGMDTMRLSWEASSMARAASRRPTPARSRPPPSVCAARPATKRDAAA